MLHLIAIAREMGIPLSIDDFDRISERTPFICDLTPGGKYVATDYQDAGGSRLLAKRLIDARPASRRIDADRHRQDARRRSRAGAVETPGQVVIHTFDKPSSQPAASSFSKAISLPKAA